MIEISDIPRDEVLSLLPQCFAEEVSYAISLNGIIWLVENFGGVTAFIPKHIKSAKKSFPGLSSNDIDSLCRQFGGGCLDIPVGTKLRRFLRNKRIFQMHEEGLSKRMIARELGMTERHVRRIFSSFAKTTEQNKDQ